MAEAEDRSAPAPSPRGTCAALAEEEGLDPASSVKCADIAALDQMLVYNRFGSFNPFGMIFALNRDVAPLAVAKETDLVDLTGATPITADDCADKLGTETRATGVGLEAGAVRLRDCKRPRPLVLRANVGDTLAIHITNLLAPAPGHDFSSDFCRREAPTSDDSRERVRPEVMFALDSLITDEADTATDGLDGWLRHGEATCLVPPSNAGRSVSKPWRRPMLFIAGCCRPRLAGLVIATSWLSACATGGSEAPLAVCPPVVEYSRELQARAAEELALLPESSPVAEMLSDYAVMRGQARACS